MNLVNKQNNITLVFNLVNKAFNSAFKLTPELSAGNKCGKVKKVNFFVSKTCRYLSLGNFDCKALCYSGFADARLTDKARVIFCSSAKNLNCTCNLAFSADNIIDFALLSTFGKIGTVSIEEFSESSFAPLLPFLRFLPFG